MGPRLSGGGVWWLLRSWVLRVKTQAPVEPGNGGVFRRYLVGGAALEARPFVAADALRVKTQVPISVGADGGGGLVTSPLGASSWRA
jgi:hypothetical protein